MSHFLEIIRVIIILFGGFFVMGYVEREIFQLVGVNIDSFGVWLLTACSNFIFLFILYRNKLQFSGWYAGKHRVRISKKATITLSLIAVCLLLLTPLF
ncbi:hypothetical protein [Brevibacillus borstelensis]|uniref:hypothetical protein n=1 Tax=Brevibacillus borstelensis TaxID=45462 RepID=UPI0030BD95B2